MSEDYLHFKNVSDITESLPSDQLESNLLAFFQYGLVSIGGFYNVTIPAPGAYGGDQHRLRPASDPNYDDGQVWEGLRKDWVWETGVPYRIDPIRVSGVFIDGDFHSVDGTGTYAHHVNYPLGRVVFDSAISPSSVVTCEFSPRYFQLYPADSRWFQEIQAGTFRADDSQFLTAGSGAWATLAGNRVQLPATVVEAEMRVEQRPFEIGNYTQVHRQAVAFHVFSEGRPDLKRLHDIITVQKDKRINAYDLNEVRASGTYPLDEYGTPAASGKMYPDLVNDHFWRQVRLVDVRSYPQPRLGSIHYAVVQTVCEIDNR